MSVADIDSFNRWREGVNEDIERGNAAREQERESRERAQHEASSQGWDAYFRGLIAEEHEILMQIIEGALGEQRIDVRDEVRHWHMWVVPIAGSTGSALRAVRPPNLHITPDGRRDLVHAASATGSL